MAFLLEKVVPWGRTMEEYVKMFSLSVPLAEYIRK